MVSLPFLLVEDQTVCSGPSQFVRGSGTERLSTSRNWGR